MPNSRFLKPYSNTITLTIVQCYNIIVTNGIVNEAASDQNKYEHIILLWEIYFDGSGRGRGSLEHGVFVPYQLSQCECINGLQRGVRSICVHEWDVSMIRPKTAADPDGACRAEWRVSWGLWISLLTKVTA